jgi:hypothetical protein
LRHFGGFWFAGDCESKLSLFGYGCVFSVTACALPLFVAISEKNGFAWRLVFWSVFIPIYIMVPSGKKRIWTLPDYFR